MAVQEIIIVPYNPLQTFASDAYQISKQYIIQKVGTEVYKAKIPHQLGHDERLLGVGQSLGNKVFSNLEIKKASYPNGSKTIEIPGLVFDTCLFTVRNAKNIVLTPVQGRNGTVKEYISSGDAQISIRGVISGLKDVYPNEGNEKENKVYNSVDKFILAMNAPMALEVSSWYLQMLGISQMVVTSFELPQTEGQYSTQFFEIEALSDEPFIVYFGK